MPITLQITRRQRHNNNRTLKQPAIPLLKKLILVLRLPIIILTRRTDIRRTLTRTAKHANIIHPLQPTNLLRRLQPAHDGQLDIHEHEVEAALPPLVDGFAAVDGGLPAHA